MNQYLQSLPHRRYILTVEFEELLRTDEQVQKMSYVPSCAWVIEERGIEKGRVEGQLETVLRLFNRKLRQSLPVEIKNQIKQFSSEKLTDLTDAVLDFDNLEDLIKWLEQH